MNKSKNGISPAGGIGFTELLQIVFIVLKLCGTIGWSWWWVLSPTWIMVGVFLITLSIVATIAAFGKE